MQIELIHRQVPKLHVQWEKVGNLGSSLPGNVGIWKEILEFGAAFLYTKTYQLCLNLEACLPGN